MHRVSTSALFAGALLASLAGSTHAQTVSSTNNSYSVTFSEATTGGGAGPYTYTYTGTLNSPANGAFVNSLTFGFTNPNAIIPFTATSDSFTTVSQSPGSIVFTALPADPAAGTPADPGFSAANTVATFSFESLFAPTTMPTALAITPSGGSNSGPGPGVGTLFVGPSAPAAAPEPGAWTALGLGGFGLLGLAVCARRRVISH